MSELHVDAVYAAGGEFGERVAHGLLIVSIATGLIVQTGIMEGTVIAFRELDWKFSLPVMIGETIRAKIEIIKTRAVPRLSGGSIVAKVSVLNQDDRVVQRGNMVLLVRSKTG
jgi:acyl dehydratase